MRVAVIGTGQQATANLYPNLRAAGLEPVAVCSLDKRTLDAVASSWGILQTFEQAPEMLESVDVDGVVMCVPPDSNAELIRVCLAAGKPVFCEKPGAVSASEAFQLAALSAELRLPLVVGYMKRFAPAYLRARAIAHGPGFGQFSMASFTFAMGSGFGGDLRTYLIDNPVHHLDLARFLVGELEDMSALVTEVPGAGHAITAIARAASGAVCSFNFCTTASWEQRNELVEIYGTGHSVCVENVDTCTHRPPERPELVWRPNYTVPVGSNSSSVLMGFVAELQHFREVSMGKAQNLSDMESAARTLVLAERLCELADVTG